MKPETTKGSRFAKGMTQEQRDDAYDGRRVKPPRYCEDNPARLVKDCLHCGEECRGG